MVWEFGFLTLKTVSRGTPDLANDVKQWFSNFNLQENYLQILLQQIVGSTVSIQYVGVGLRICISNRLLDVPRWRSCCCCGAHIWEPPTLMHQNIEPSSISDQIAQRRDTKFVSQFSSLMQRREAAPVLTNSWKLEISSLGSSEDEKNRWELETLEKPHSFTGKEAEEEILVKHSVLGNEALVLADPRLTVLLSYAASREQ